MAGYNARQSTYSDGDVIDAADSNDEFDAILAAFVNTTGHAHDGTAGEGPVIGLIGDAGVATPLNKVVVDTTNDRLGFFVDVSSSAVEQVRIQDGAILPVTTNDIDLGSSSLQFKDIYLDGTATIDGLAMPTTTVTDILDQDDMSSDSATALATQQSIKAYVDSQVTAQDLDFQGDSGGALSIDLDSEVLDIAGGTGIDTAGSGNTLTVSIDSTVATLAGTQTFTNKTFDANGTGNSLSNVEVADLAASAVVTESEGIGSNDNDTTLPTSAAVKDYVDSQVETKDALSELSGDSDDITEGTTNLFYTDTRARAVSIENVVEDTTPQLGGDLSSNGNLISFADSASASADRLKFGTGNDSELYHTGTTTFFKTNVGATTVIDTPAVSIKYGSEFLASFNGNASVSLYYDNSKKFETSTTGATITGSLNVTDASTTRTNLGVAIGSDVQAYDAQLADIAGLTPTDGNVIIGDGANFVLESGATLRTSLGLTIGTDVQAYDAELAALAGLTSAADKVPYFTGSGTAAVADFTSFGRSLVDDANAAAARTTLDVDQAGTAVALAIALG